MAVVAFAGPAPYSLSGMTSHQSKIGALRPQLQRSRGAAELGFRRRDGATRVAHLFQSDPCRVLFPYPEPGDVQQAVLVTTSGGLTDGDSVRLAVTCESGTEVVVSGQAAEKIYRAGAESNCTVDISLSAGEGAVLEWLPQETILFDGARLRRRTDVSLAADARLLACEMLAFGRSASGETFTHGFVHDAWRLRRDGKLVWADALQVTDALPGIAGFGDAPACGFAVYAGAGTGGEALLAASRAVIERQDSERPALRCGTTAVNGIVLARFLGDSRDVRLAMMDWLATLRSAAFGRPARLPRVWYV